MPSFNDLRNAVSEWMQRNVAPVQGNFFQSRTTQTPGIITNLGVPGAAATYSGADDPSSVVRSSNLNSDLRNALSSEWAGKKGMIRVDSQYADQPKILPHEQVHDVFEKGGLSDSAPQIAPLLDKGWLNYVRDSPIYKGVSDSQQVNEALAYQLTSGHEKGLAAVISAMLTAKGKPQQADQIMRLTK